MEVAGRSWPENGCHSNFKFSEDVVVICDSATPQQHTKAREYGQNECFILHLRAGIRYDISCFRGRRSWLQDLLVNKNDWLGFPIGNASHLFLVRLFLIHF